MLREPATEVAGHHPKSCRPANLYQGNETVCAVKTVGQNVLRPIVRLSPLCASASFSVVTAIRVMEISREVIAPPKSQSQLHRATHLPGIDASGHDGSEGA